MFALVPVDTFAYKLLFLLHIVSIVVAFAPGWVLPGLSRKVDHTSLAAGAARNSQFIHAPALVLAGLFGFGLVGLSKPSGASEGIFRFGQAWVSVAALLWFLMLGVLFGLMIPAERKVGAGDSAAAKLTAMGGGILHLLFLAMVIDMIWKPGF